MSKEKHIFEEAFKPLPKRIVTSLLKSDYDSLEELHELSDKDLIEISGITKNSLSDIRALLAANGFIKEVEFDDAAALVAAHKLTASRGVSDKEQVVEPETGIRLLRRSGQVAMKCNLYDPGFRRENNGQKLSVKIGDVVLGNKNKEWDLPRKYVDNLIARGEAA